VPQDRQVLAVPREDAAAVREQEPLGPEVAANREQPILGEVDRRKREALVEPEHRHGAQHSRVSTAA
jgi:hypothetical protein